MRSDRPDVGVTAPAGFSAAGLRCGVAREGPDLALVLSDRLASAAAVFTRNRVQAAPVQVAREALRRSGGRARAVVVNAGNANACTGPAGMEAARRTAREAARLLGAADEEILVASTGVIGEPLAVDRIVGALPALAAAAGAGGGADAARAIMTTDTRPKQAARSVVGPGGGYTIGGMAKGSGMIHPDMATTLGFVTTDAAIAPGRLQALLSAAIDRSFNRVTVDGDTSTNDMVAALAGGASGVALDGEADEARFGEALEDLLVELARAVAADGEGATRLVTVTVTGARSEAEALQVARTIAGSPLVKTAVHGGDPNWGRIAAAVGRAGVAVEPERLRVSIGDAVMLAPGMLPTGDEEAGRRALQEAEVRLGVHLGQGAAEATCWTCDLTCDYIHINASYRT